MTEHTETRHTPATAPTVYCYRGQTDEVRKFFAMVGLGNPVSIVSSPDQMRHMPHGSTFFEIKDHLEAVTEEIYAMLAAKAVTVVVIDNSRVPA